MLLKINKMTPRCPKQLPGDEYTGESQLPVVNTPGSLVSPGDEYTGESRLPCDEYTGESTSKCTLNKHKNMLTKKLSDE
jgi:hypothetical protein